MGTISVSLPADGETIDAADYNTPITTIVNEVNGGLDNSNIASDAAISGSKLADTSVTTGKLADASVTNAKLSTTAGDVGGAWLAWTPTLSNRLNNAKWTKNCLYTQIGKTVHFKFTIKATTTTPMDGGIAEAVFTLPVTAATIAAQIPPIGLAGFLDYGTARVAGWVEYRTTTTARIRYIDTAAAVNGAVLDPTSTTPFTWTTDDEIYCQGTYEAA